MSLSRIALILTLLLIGKGAVAAPEDRAAAVKEFAREMAARHGFDQQELLKTLSKARFRHDIIKAMQRPAEGKPWHQYRPIFVTRARARGGLSFWRDNQELLARVEREYGVAPEIIVAIIGVETRYGGYIGKHLVLDALSTLTFGYPKRAKFFRSQLEEFLLLAKEEDVDLETSVGSYAGAMGLPQFIPSSYRAYAVDFDGDGKRDLFDSTADIIGSVANYFKRHGWRPGGTVALKAHTGNADTQVFVKAGMKPSIPVSDLKKSGISVDKALNGDELASLVRLQLEGDHEHWLGLNNFYTITRYNHSNLYAMAVYQLSREILALREEEQHELPGR